MESYGCSEEMKVTDRENFDNFMDEFHAKFQPLFETLTSLLTYIELQHESTEILLKQLENDFANEGIKQRFQGSTRVAKEHVMKLEGTVINTKDATMKSLREFVKFIEKFDKENVKPKSQSSCYVFFNTDCSRAQYNIEEENIKRVLKENEDLNIKVSRLETYVMEKDKLEKTFIKERKLLKTQKDDFVKEIDELTADYMSFQDKCNSAEKMNTEIIDRLETLQWEYKDRTESWENTEKSLQNKIKEVTSQVTEHKEKVEQLEKEKIENENIIKSYSAEIYKFKEMNHSFESNLNTLQAQLALLQEKNEQLENKIKECLYEKEKIQNSLVNLTAEMTRREESINSLEKEKQLLDCQVNENKEKVGVLKTEIEAMRNENKQKQENIEAANNRILSIKEDKQQIQIINESLNCQVETLKISNENANVELEKRMSEIRKLEIERDGLKSKCSNITQECDKMNNEINRSNKKINELQVDVETKNETIQQLKQDREMKENQLIQLKEEIASLQSRLSHVQKEKDSLNDAMNKTKIEYSKKVQDRDDQIKEILHRNDELDRMLKAKTTELDLSRTQEGKLFNELEIKKKENENLEGILLRKTAEYDHLKATYERERQEHYEEKNKLISKYDIHVRESKDIQAELEKKLEKARDEMADKRNELHGKERSIEKLEKKNLEMNEENKRISRKLDLVEADLAEFISIKTMPVQLYSQNRTNLTDIVEEGLTVLLKERLESPKLKLDIIQCAKSSDIQPDIPVLLLCITVSRLGTDAANSINGLTVNNKMALLVFHHKDVHALPNQASDRVLTGPDMKALGGICDMAFLSGKGIYHCDMNTNNIISIINFINREGVKKANSTLSR